MINVVKRNRDVGQACTTDDVILVGFIYYHPNLLLPIHSHQLHCGRCYRLISLTDSEHGLGLDTRQTVRGLLEWGIGGSRCLALL